MDVLLSPGKEVWVRVRPYAFRTILDEATIAGRQVIQEPSGPGALLTGPPPGPPTEDFRAGAICTPEPAGTIWTYADVQLVESVGGPTLGEVPPVWTPPGEP